MNKEEVISFLIRYERECRDSIIDRQHCLDWFSDLEIKFDEKIQCMSCEKIITKKEALVFCGECGR